MPDDVLSRLNSGMLLHIKTNYNGMSKHIKPNDDILQHKGAKLAYYSCLAQIILYYSKFVQAMTYNTQLAQIMLYCIKTF